MNAKERKKHQKNKTRDKIGAKDARVLTGGMTYADNAAAIKKLENKVSTKSKKIKKSAGGHEITKESVVAKLNTRRLAIPQSRFKA